MIVEENTHKKVQYVYIPSPSRSATSMTSGDLADISSSMSRSSVSSGSLGSKVSVGSSGSSSLDHTGAHSIRLAERQSSLDQPEACSKGQDVADVSNQQGGESATSLAMRGKVDLVGTV